MASTKTFSLLLMLTLFSLTFASFIDPESVQTAFNAALNHESCTETSDKKGCAQALPNADHKVRGSYKFTKETTMTSKNSIALAQQSVNMAKEAGVNVLFFMSSVVGEPINRPAMIKCIDTCNVTINGAVKELDKCVELMQGKVKLSALELRALHTSVNHATESAVKCSVSCKHTKADMQMMFENLLDQFIKMSKIAIKVTSMISAAA